MKIMKWTSWLVIACLGLMSCERQEVAETAAVVAVVSTVVALGMVLGEEDASAHDHDDDDDDNYYGAKKKRKKKNTSSNDHYFSCRDGNICTSYIDYSGRGRESCGVVHVCQTGRHTHIHEGYDEHAHHSMPIMQHHHPRHYFMHQSTNTSTLTDPVLVAEALEGRSVMELVSPQDFGRVHGMSTAAAQWLLEGIDKAREGDMSVLEEGGVSELMLAQLSSAELPSVEQVDELARKLDQYPPVTIAMFSRFISVY